MRVPRLTLQNRAADAHAGNAALGALAGFFVWQLGLLGILGIPNSPALVVAVCAAGGLVASVAGLSRWLVWLDAVVLAMYLVIALTPIVSRPVRRWARVDQLGEAPLDAVVVLSAGLVADSSLGVQGSERLLTALELMRAGVAPRLVTTRVTEKFGQLVENSDAGQRRLIGLAGLDEKWAIVDSVHTTRDEAVGAARLLQRAGGSAIAVVTSPIHTRRACATFEAVGFRVTCIAARGIEFNTRNPVTPPDRLQAFREYAYERIAMVEYRWKGWLPGATAPK